MGKNLKLNLDWSSSFLTVIFLLATIKSLCLAFSKNDLDKFVVFINHLFNKLFQPFYKNFFDSVLNKHRTSYHIISQILPSLYLG